jgi:hypothetical protein
MFNTIFDIKGTFHFEFISQGQTVKQAYYVGILKQLCETVCRQAQELDSAPWPCSNSQGAVKQFLAKKSITEMEYSPHSPDLAPNDF